MATFVDTLRYFLEYSKENTEVIIRTRDSVGFRWWRDGEGAFLSYSTTRHLNNRAEIPQKQWRLYEGPC